MQVEENVPLAPLTTFCIGGPARFFVRVTNIDELKEALAFAKEKQLKVFILGGGSNVLVVDEGFDGLVIKIEIAGVEIEKTKNGATFTAAAGESWDSLVERAVAENLWGIENLSGIPGTVGGAVVQNIGAYGRALSQTCSWVEALDYESGEVRKFTNTECYFDYRDSIFQDEGKVSSGGVGLPFISPERGTFPKSRYVVLRAAFELSSIPKPDISYRDLAARFAGKSPTLQEMRAAVLEIRAAKFPDLALEGTAGSFFKNPIVSRAEALTLKERYPELPLFDMPETDGVKIPLAWLFDHALELRGARHGAARLFEKQLLVIAVHKNSSARDVRALAREVSKDVKGKLNIDIEPEVKIIF